MASVTLKDSTGRWQHLLLGLFLSVSLVLGQTTSVSPTTTNVISSTAGATANPVATTTNTAAPTQTSSTITNSVGMTSTIAPPSTSTGASTTATTAPSSASTQSQTSTAPPSVSTTITAASSTMSASAGAASSSTMSSASSSYVTSSSGMSSSISTSSTMNTTGSGMNETTAWSNSSVSMISCHSFMCNYSDCYSMYKNQNATKCASGYNYCEVIRQMSMCYTVSCSASCSKSCVNASQSNCSVNCCNSTGCLNETFASMMMTTTTTVTTTTKATTTSATTTTTAATTTPAGKKCNSGKCNGTDCYKTFNSHLVCTSSQPHCQLKKETVGTNMQWTAGCTTNCSGQTSCKTDTQPPCYLECCNATLTSCLFLNGTLNVPSFATRGPQLHYELVTSVLCLFAISLML